jgi:D-alanyl-D-alanine carboxypeptidase
MIEGARAVATIRPGILPVLMLAVLFTFGLHITPASAQIGSDRYSSIVIEARTGRELSSVNADEPRHPASLTKMMTLYMVFEALRDRRIGLETPVPVTAHASSMQPTKLGLVPGTRLTVEQAIFGLVTLSANDAASALGELLGQDESNFAQMMTLRAHALGMTRTSFRNASGLPDAEQLSTARDMATLARHLVSDFPAFYHYFSTPEFRFHGRLIQNHDHLLETYPGADGLKTGYTQASGFNLVTSAVHSDVRLIGVVMGAARAAERDIHMAVLLNQGFEMLDVPPPAMVARRDGQRAPLISQANAAPPPASPVAANHSISRQWAVQIGAFNTEAAARQAAAAVRRAADSGQVHIESAVVKGKTTWRAMLIGLSPSEANETCAGLARHKQACTILKPESHQLASR